MSAEDRASEPLGTLEEEAAKLFGAFSQSFDAHGDSQSTDCEWCPVCRGVRAVRGISPEVLGHLSAAATSLAQAVSAFLEDPEHVRAQAQGGAAGMDDESDELDPHGP